MRRILLVLTVALVMAAMVVALAVPAFAQADPHASCQGAAHSNQEPPGTAGHLHSTLIPELGRSNGEVAKLFARAAPPGPDRNTQGPVVPDDERCSWIT